MVQLKLISLILSVILTVHAASAGDNAPPRLDRPAEIVIIGDGEVMDALQRAVEDEVAVINEDGGVMGQPLKISREACRTRSEEQAAAQSIEVAARKPILVFQSDCDGRQLKPPETFATANILFMAIGDWPADLTTDRKGPTVFRLSPRYDRKAQELALILATAEERVIGFLPSSEVTGEDALKAELAIGFSETGKWGTLADARELQFVPADQLLNAITPEKSSLLVSTKPIKPDSVFTETRWKGRVIVAPASPTNQTPIGLPENPSEPPLTLPEGVQIHDFQKQPFYVGKPPEGAKAYTAFHPDWVAGFWQVMKALKYAKSLDGREIAKDLGGSPFFARAPWLMLQSRSRFVPHELRQRFNDNGDLRMAGYKLEKLWPK